MKQIAIMLVAGIASVSLLSGISFAQEKNQDEKARAGKDIQEDKNQVQNDREEIKGDRKKIDEDVSKIKDTKKDGEAALQEKKGLRKDREALRRDRRELQRDRHDLMQDRMKAERARREQRCRDHREARKEKPQKDSHGEGKTDEEGKKSGRHTPESTQDRKARD